MTFGFEFSSDYRLQQALEGQQKMNALDAATRQKQLAELDFQKQRSISDLDNASRTVELSNIELARRKAQQRLNNFNAGVVSAKDQEEQMSDFERKKQLGDYQLDVQQKAWDAANKYRMAEADQSNVAQKDRLGMQLDTQKGMQQAQFGQDNKLLADANRRAIDGYKMNF